MWPGDEWLSVAQTSYVRIRVIYKKVFRQYPYVIGLFKIWIITALAHAMNTRPSLSSPSWRPGDEANVGYAQTRLAWYMCGVCDLHISISLKSCTVLHCRILLWNYHQLPYTLINLPLRITASARWHAIRAWNYPHPIPFGSETGWATQFDFGTSRKIIIGGFLSYCICGNFRLEKIFTNFTNACHWRKFFPWIFLHSKNLTHLCMHAHMHIATRELHP